MKINGISVVLQWCIARWIHVPMRLASVSKCPLAGDALLVGRHARGRRHCETHSNSTNKHSTKTVQAKSITRNEQHDATKTKIRSKTPDTCIRWTKKTTCTQQYMWKKNLLQHMFEIKAGHIHKSNTVNVRVWHACLCVACHKRRKPTNPINPDWSWLIPTQKPD